MTDVETVPDPTAAAPNDDEIEPEMMLDLSKKKKKKKKTEEPGDAAVPSSSAQTEGDEEGSGEGGADEEGEDELDLDLSKKKKKKKASVSFGEDEILGEDKVAPTVITGLDDGNASWQGQDRDYEYKEMLGRIVARLRASNPDLVGAPRKFAVKPPLVHKEGKQKAVFVNFMEICKSLKREPEHLLAFLLAELGTTGSIDGSKRLIIKGRLQQKHIESILRRYIAEYVTCALCRSPHTRLVKENRLFFLRCENCGASRSVAPVKSGYVAQVGKRKKK